MSHMHIVLHDKRPLWLKRPLKGKRSRDACYALLGSAVPSTKVPPINDIQNKDPFVHRLSAVGLTSPAGRVVPACW